MNEDKSKYNVPPQESQPSELPEKKHFWQRNGATLITLAILGLIIGGAIALNERRGGEIDNADVVENEVAVDQDSGELGSGQEDKKDLPAVTGAIRITEVRAAEENGQETHVQFEVSALPGEGLTHLARRSITEQLRRVDSQLTPEQRVYAEDYLQKNYAPRIHLDPGTTVTFTEGQINEAISAAQGLSDAQLENLKQWSVLVDWPPI